MKLVYGFGFLEGGGLLDLPSVMIHPHDGVTGQEQSAHLEVFISRQEVLHIQKLKGDSQ